MDNLIKYNKIVLSCFYKKKLLRDCTTQFLPLVLHESCSPTPVLRVHEIATYIRFSMLKNSNFNLVPSFHGPISRSCLSLRTLDTSPSVRARSELRKDILSACILVM